MTQIDNLDIQNHTITGASMNPEFGIYDETYDYSIDEETWFNGKIWRAIAAITGTNKGDLSQAPNINSKWEVVRGVAFSIYPSAAQTFTTTEITVKYDTIRYDNPAFTLDNSTGIITVNSGGVYVVSLTQTNDNTTGTRDTSWTYIEVDKNDGSGFVKIPNWKISGYHRSQNDGETTGTSGTLIHFGNGDLVRVNTRGRTASTLTTVPDACNFLLWAPAGSRGPQGDTGPAGPPGGVTTFTGLTDTPADYTGNASKIPSVRLDELGIEFVTPPTAISTLTGLSDTPTNYTGEAGNTLKVKQDETGVEFVLDEGNIEAESVVFNGLYTLQGTDIDVEDGQYQTHIMTSSLTLTITEPVGPCTFYLHVYQDPTGGRTLTLPSGQWPGGVVKQLTLTTNAHDLLMIHYYGNSHYMFDIISDLS